MCWILEGSLDEKILNHNEGATVLDELDGFLIIRQMTRMNTDQGKEDEGQGEGEGEVPLLCAADLGGYVLPERYGDFEEMFPNRVYINLGVREERRSETEYQFQTQGFAVQRFAAVRGWKARKKRGHGNGNKYACRLSHRLVLRRAWLEGLDSVVIFLENPRRSGFFPIKGKYSKKLNNVIKSQFHGNPVPDQ